MRPEFVIGIDPGVETGIALYSRTERKLAALLTLDFWRAYDYVRDRFTPETAEIVVETPDSKRAMYARTENVQEARKRERMASNVGSNRREAVLLAERFEQLGFTVRRETPTARKWTREQFERYTGHKGCSSQHARDAARLCFGL